MKGIIFTEFIEMMENEFGFALTNRVIENSESKSGGIYTSTRTYDHLELVSMVKNLSKESGIETAVLLRSFGKYLFTQFVRIHPSIIHRYQNGLDLLQNVEGHIHKEVRKLYNESELPKLEYIKADKYSLVKYSSVRDLNHFAYGLIEGCFEHFEEHVEIEMIQIGPHEWQFKLLNHEC